ERCRDNRRRGGGSTTKSNHPCILVPERNQERQEGRGRTDSRHLMADTLFQKVWNAHAVRTLPSGQTQLFVGLHLVHEVTTPQAFDMLRQHGWRVAFPERTFATVDHIVPTSTQNRPFLDLVAEDMATALERNCRGAGIELWTPDSEEQGIVHVIGP